MRGRDGATIRCEIVVAHVINPEPWRLLPPQEMHPALCHDRRATEKKMASLLKGEHLRGVRIETVIKQGDFRQVLCNIVHEQHVDCLSPAPMDEKVLPSSSSDQQSRRSATGLPARLCWLDRRSRRNTRQLLKTFCSRRTLVRLSLGALPLIFAFAAQHGSRLRIARVVPDEYEIGAPAATLL